MSCRPANVTGAFFLALLIFDLIYKKWSDLPLHAILGAVVIGIVWGICYAVNEAVSAAILVVPIVFLVVFLVAAWFFGKYLPKPEPEKCEEPKDECAQKEKVKAIFVPRTDKCKTPEGPIRPTPGGSGGSGSSGGSSGSSGSGTSGSSGSVSGSSYCQTGLNAVSVL